MYIVVSDVDSGHASGIVSNIQTYCPDATIETRIESFTLSVNYALTASVVDGIVRPTTGLDDSRISEISQLWNAGKWVVHAHGSNSNILISDPTYLGEAIVARSNGSSYGPGIEITVASASNESQASGYLGGMFAQIRHQNSWSLETTRQALREKSAGWDSGWNSSTGYGNVDFLAAISGTNTYILNTVTSFSMLVDTPAQYSYSFDWTAMSSSYNLNIVILSSSGSLSSSFDSGISIYQTAETASSYSYGNTTYTGSHVVALFNSGSSSRLESWNFGSISLSYGLPTNPSPLILGTWIGESGIWETKSIHWDGTFPPISIFYKSSTYTNEKIIIGRSSTYIPGTKVRFF